MLITLTPTLKKACTLLPSFKVLKGKGKGKETVYNSNNKDIVDALEE